MQLRNTSLSNLLNKQYPEYSKDEFYEVLQIICLGIESEVQKGNEVRLENFGTFYPKYNKQRSNIALHTKERGMIPESVTFGFHASEAMVKRIKTNADIAAIRPRIDTKE